MERVSNINFKGYYPTYPSFNTQRYTNNANMQFKDGDKKSVDMLSWMGKIALAGVTVAGISAAAIKGKGIDSSLVDINKLTNEGVAVLTEDGQKLNKLKKLLFNVAEDGTIRSGKVVSQNGDKTISTLIKNGKRIAEETSTASSSGIKKVLEKKEYNGEKLIKKITPNETIDYTYGNNGTVTELIQRKKGVKTERIANITQNIEGEEPISFSFTPRKGEKVDSVIESGFAYSIGKIKKGRSTTEVYRIISGDGITEFAIVTSGKKQKIIYKVLDEKDKVKTFTKKIKSDDDLKAKFGEATTLLYNSNHKTYEDVFEMPYDDFMEKFSPEYEGRAFDWDIFD